MNTYPMSDAAAAKNHCVQCDSTQTQTLFSAYAMDKFAEKYDLVECDECQLVKISPFLNFEEVAKYYDTEYYGSKQKKFVGWAEKLTEFGNRMRAGALTRLFKPDHSPQKTKVLDVGCGRGFFLKVLSKQGYQCYGVDIADFPFAQDDFGVTYRQGVLEDVEFEPQQFDAVTIWHVLEHVQNPAKTVKRMSEIVKPGGIVAIAVPNFDSWQRKLFGRHWCHLDLPRHLYHLNQKTLFNMLEKNQLKPFAVKTFDPIQSVFGFVQGVVNWFFARSEPNLLLRIIKGDRYRKKGLGYLFKVASVCIVAGLAMPFALIETLLSAALGKGSMLMVYSRR